MKNRKTLIVRVTIESCGGNNCSSRDDPFDAVLPSPPSIASRPLKQLVRTNSNVGSKKAGENIQGLGVLSWGMAIPVVKFHIQG